MRVTVNFDKIEIKETNTVGTVKIVMLKGEKGDPGTNDYSQAENKPSVQGVTLEGDRTLDDLGAASKVSLETTKTYLEEKISTNETNISKVTVDVEAIKVEYITKAVSDLLYYYKKNETYTQAEVNQLISAIPKFSIQVVDELPSSDISDTTVYLLKTSTTESGNLYTEYIYVDGWETLGTQTLDLSGYATINITNSISESLMALITSFNNHNHDSRYYTEDEIDTIKNSIDSDLSKKLDSGKIFTLSGYLNGTSSSNSFMFEKTYNKIPYLIAAQIQLSSNVWSDLRQDTNITRIENNTNSVNVIKTSAAALENYMVRFAFYVPQL